MTFYTKKRKMPQVIIVSLIDIFAILLIFVIVTTTFKKELPPEMTIQLPESKSAVVAAKVKEPIVLTINKEEQIFLDDKQVTMPELREQAKKLIAEREERPLALNADKKAPFGTVIQVVEILRDAGLKGELAAFMDAQQQSSTPNP